MSPQLFARSFLDVPVRVVFPDKTCFSNNLPTVFRSNRDVVENSSRPLRRTTAELQRFVVGVEADAQREVHVFTVAVTDR